MDTRKLTTLAALFLLAGSLRAQTVTNLNISSTTAAWVELAASARTEAMGEAFVAVADDVNALNVNPGGLGQLKQDQISLTHESYVQNADIEQGLASFALGSGNVGIGLTYGNFGTVAEYSVSGSTVSSNGSYQPTAWKANLGYGLPLMTDLYAGISGELLIDGIYTNQLLGVGGSAGLLWVPKNNGLSLGLSLLDLGTLNNEAIPTELRAGASYRLTIKNDGQDFQSLLVSADGFARTQDFTSNRAALGVEYDYHNRLYLRAGQELFDTTGITGLSGFSVGVGIRINPITIDYAFATRGDLGNLNLISLSSGL